MLPLLKQFCRIPSVTNDMWHNRIMIDMIKDFFIDCDVTITEKKKRSSINLIIANHHDKRADIVLNGHVDVVPPATDGQFDPFVQWDKLYARWAWDMKGAVVVMMYAFRDLLLSWDNLPKISLIITTDEETGGFDGAQYLTDQWYGWEVVLVPDSGSSQDIVIAEKWWIRIWLSTQAPWCHAARPWLSDNPLDRIYDLYHDLKQTYEHKALYNDDQHRWNSVSLTMVSGGVSWGTIPPEATAMIDMRCIEWYDVHQIYGDVLEKVATYQIDIISQTVVDQLYSDPAHPTIQAYLASAQKIIWPDVRLTREHGASDGRRFARKGCTVILQRPTCAHIHAADERVSLSSMQEIYHIMKDFISQYTL